MLIAFCTNETERNNCGEEILRTWKTPDSFQGKNGKDRKESYRKLPCIYENERNKRKIEK